MQIKHIAIIMDGNGRWAEKRGLPRSEGHKAGAVAARRVTRAVGKMEIPWLTLYTLSTENLYRPQKELDDLAALMRHYLDNEVPVLAKNRVRLKVIGDRGLLPPDLRRKINAAEETTGPRHLMTLCLAICYGGRDEIVRAVNAQAKKGQIKKMTEPGMAAALDTSGMPDPDLIIRTGGEYRISNFLIWQAAYSELYFTKTLWPDFGSRQLKAALDSFRRRERRFGMTGERLEREPAASGRKRGKLR